MSANRERSAWRRYAMPLALIGCLPALAACEQASRTHTGNFPAAGAVAIELSQSASSEQAQVAISPQLQPAPDIFEATGRALWDGKRTLQGVWVAHPLAASARRVRIFNIDNGAAADGALFKRDAALQGAPVLISSEAAELLGMTAGVEARLRIVAVSPVKTRAAEAKPAEQTPEDQTSKPVESQAAAQPEPKEPEPEPEPVAAAQPAQPAAATPAPKPEPESTVAAVQPAPTPKPKAAPKPEPAAPATAEDDPEPEKPEHKDRVFKFEQPTQPDPAAKTEPEIKTAAKPKAQPSNLRQPFVQAGVFGVTDNAKRLVRRLKNKGIPALRKTVTSGGRTLNRVLAGPFNSTKERNRAQATIRAMGLKDAIPVRR